jgi:tellurite resistance protein TerC
LLFQKKEKKIDLEKNIAIRILKTFVPINLNINSNKFLLKQNGILYTTPLLVALVIIELADILFPIDSIPAVLAISSDYFIVITSNIFPILGLKFISSSIWYNGKILLSKTCISVTAFLYRN